MPLSGAYQEFYLGVKATNNTEADGYSLNAKIAKPLSSTSQRIEDIASKNNLSVTGRGSDIEVSGAVARANLQKRSDGIPRAVAATLTCGANGFLQSEPSNPLGVFAMNDDGHGARKGD